jgi:exonuclease SbcD
VKIFHVADIHLGCRRLGGRLPDTDLFLAFQSIARQAIKERAEIFLIAGDLFDRAQVEPTHLRQAQQVLAELKDAGIRTIGIEGNHDRSFLHSDEPTWVQFLADDDLIVLLRPEFGPEGARLFPWDFRLRKGAWIEVDGVRFVGAGYLGAATPHKTKEITARLDAGRAHVLLLHAGPAYFVGEGGGFSAEDLKAVHEKVSYLALGHIHRPMVYGNWACNPGSPENLDFKEAAYDLDRDEKVVNRGFAVVKIDPGRLEERSSFEVRSNPRRPVRRLVLDCSPFGTKTKDGVATFVKAAVKLVRQSSACAETAIDLRLAGILNLDRIAIDQTALSLEIARQSGVFAVGIDVGGLNVGGRSTDLAGEGIGLSREEIEKRAIRSYLEKGDLLGLEGVEDEMGNLLYEIKEAVREGRRTTELMERIGSTSIVALIMAKHQGERLAATDDR